MAYLINMPKAVWKRQPNGLFALRKEYERADHVFLGNSPQNSGISVWTKFGSPILAAGPEGVGSCSLVNNVANYWQHKLINLFTAGWPGLTVLTYHRSPTTTNFDSVSGAVQATANFVGGWNITLHSTTQIIAYPGNDSNTNLSLTVAPNEDIVSCLSWDKSIANFALSRNRGIISRISQNRTTDFVNQTVNITATGYTRTSTSWRVCTAPVYLVAVLPYHIDETEQIELINNPWQIFNVTNPVFYSIPSSGPVTFKPAWARSRSLIIGSGV